jgi:outer membrane lipopolysaccharide assembly protein LptE/RlpB
MNRRFKLMFIISVVVLLAGCGYRFSRGPSLPEGIQSLYIANFENQTSEIGVENDLVAHIIDEFTNVRRARLASDRGSADAVLTGSITAITIFTISRVGESVSDERRVQVTVDAVLTDVNGRTIKKAKGITNGEAYRVDPDNNQVTESNKKEALERVADKLAELTYHRLAEDL